MSDISDSHPLFSILIPTWNNLEYLKVCIESIEKNSTYRHEILIHVNDGSDGTLDWVKEKGYKFSRSAENIGVCYAMNSLRPLMTTDYLLYINDDMYVCPGWDEVLYKEVCKMEDKMWFLGSTIIQPKAIRRHPLSVRVGDFGRKPSKFKEKELLARFKEFAPGDWRGPVFPPNLVHRDIWDLVGGYSVEYSPGLGSDPDFVAKLYSAGVRKFKGLGESLVYHFMSVSVNRIRKNAGDIQFLRKWRITIRGFMKEFIHLDTKWEEHVSLDRKAIRREKIRSSIKNLLTNFKNVHSTSSLFHFKGEKRI